jgi:hypothetical protein
MRDGRLRVFPVSPRKLLLDHRQAFFQGGDFGSITTHSLLQTCGFGAEFLARQTDNFFS